MKIQVFGDSHSRYFEKNPKLIFHAPWCKDLDLEVYKIPASTIVGLGKKRSKMNVKEQILNLIDKDAISVFCFGQVDLELGYYYRKVVKKENVDLDSFIGDLAEKYFEFIKTTGMERVVVKGLNLTVLKEPGFAFNYVSRIITENIVDSLEIDASRKKLRETMETFSERNMATIKFNQILKTLCKEKGYLYFDVNDFLSGFSPKLGCLDKYHPAGFDHHVIDSIEVRKAHLNALINVCELV